MEHIDARRALELLIDIVDQYGEDTVYEKVPLDNGNMGCRYEREGAASCLIGRALYRAGAPLGFLAHIDLYGVSARMLPCHTNQVDTDAAEVFQAAQGIQDAGETWGKALRGARSWYDMHVRRESK